MKKVILFTLILGGIIFPALAQTADEKAIMKAIAEEVDTFYANDYENWTESFTKTPEFQRVYDNENGETISWNWKKFNKNMKKLIHQKFPQYSYTMDNYQAKVIGNLAMASLISTFTWDEKTGAKPFVRPHIYVLKRIGDEWKISYYRSGLIENSTIHDGQ